MAKKKLYKSKTNFTLKRLHQSGSYGHIYERDYTTIPSTTVIPEGQISAYNSPSFHLTVRAGYNGQKKYNYGEWLSNPSECGDINNTSWTLSCMPEPNKVDSKIIVKPNSNNLTSYVYFSSANELIKASIGNIVANFPAEIYITNKSINDSGLLERSDISPRADIRTYGSYYLIDNPFMIDLTQLTIPEKSIVSPLRYMCESYDKYNIINGENISNIYKWEVFSEETTNCISNGDKLATIKFSGIRKEVLLIIECFYLDNNIIYCANISNVSVRPNDEAVNSFFNDLDDFEKLLLNQYTDYTVEFETFKEDNEEGWQMSNIKYQWPTSQGDWNLTLNGKAYNDYITRLSELAEGYDNLFTNVIWRCMTHESIVNMDLTFTRNGEQVTTPNSSKLNMMLNIFGRQFDELKKYTDNIKNTRRVNYSQNGCMPDYFLSDELNSLGWETKTILNDISNELITEPMYGARTIGFTSSDVNGEFMRRLSLNSKNIFRKKGTKMGIEDLMAVFGYHSLDWLRRSKNVNVVKADDIDLRRAYILHEYTYVVNGYANGVSGTTLVNNVKRINELKDGFPSENINNEEYIDSYYGLPVAEVLNPDTNAKDGDKSTLIPWFDKELNYDGNVYFQMYGGWSGVDDKYGKRKYEHTVSRIHFVPKQNDLFDLNYYQIDENGLYYVGEEGKYYKIKNIEQYQTLNGWYQQDKIDTKEIEEAENIIDNNKGNNPHTGLYDDGYGYLNSFASFFSNTTFENARLDETEQQIGTFGFNIERQEDLTKCVYLKDSLVNGVENKMLYNRLRPKSTIKPRNPFKGKDESIEYTEIAGTSIMNNKVFHIEFDDSHKEFIEQDIIPYLKQMIPSTTIFSYSFKRLTGDEIGTSTAQTAQIVCDGDTCPIYGVA